MIEIAIFAHLATQRRGVGGGALGPGRHVPRGRRLRLQFSPAVEGRSKHLAAPNFGGPTNRPEMSGRSMDLKGADRSDVVGKRVLCKHDEGGEAPVPYSGVVTYAERGRLHVVFDHFAEEEGAWIDDSDDWSWLPDGPTPRPPPITGLWKPGLVAPQSAQGAHGMSGPDIGGATMSAPPEAQAPRFDAVRHAKI